MTEKRKFTRYQCFVTIDFDYYEGDPDNIDIATTPPIKGSGHMLDISRGGAFIVSNTRVAVNMPVKLRFASKKKKYEVLSSIVRTGLLKNNPSEVAQKYAAVKVREDAYIALKFNSPLEDISESDFA